MKWLLARLALLAFLGAGHSHRSGEYQDEVDRGLKWLVQRQKADGDLFVEGSELVWLYSHGMAAIALCEQPGVMVALVYGGEAFNRVKEKNRTRLEQARAAGKVKVMLKSDLIGIGRDRVALTDAGRAVELRNDAVIVNAGGVLPRELLKNVGIAFETKFGTA